LDAWLAKNRDTRARDDTGYRPAGVELNGVPATGCTWEPLTVDLPAKRPRVDPGMYQARAVTLRRFRAYDRTTLELGFEVWRGDPLQMAGESLQESPPAELLAIVPLFMPWPGKDTKGKAKAQSPNSQIALLFYLMGRSGATRSWLARSALSSRRATSAGVIAPRRPPRCNAGSFSSLLTVGSQCHAHC
jgi:hypothetical protein